MRTASLAAAALPRILRFVARAETDSACRATVSRQAAADYAPPPRMAAASSVARWRLRPAELLRGCRVRSSETVTIQHSPREVPHADGPA
jgi:hypothetical protein